MYRKPPDEPPFTGDDILCEFRDGVCAACGRVEFGVPVICDVKGAAVKRGGLGDYLAQGLAAIGITKERVEAVVGGPCGCDGRQAAMNAAGAKYLGLSPGSTAPENKG